MRIQNLTLNIDLSSGGRVFEGIGGISSNGTSKLLLDYPEEQQADIIDQLFKPNFGAGLQQLKLEIGADANTSSGIEPSHMRSKQDFDISRGTGLWLAQRAKAANPDLMLSALRWGTPRWIADDSDKFLFYRNYLQGAFEKYGLKFDYLGADINEGPFDRDWTVNVLRKNLDSCGYDRIGIVAADSENDWFIADLVSKDHGLKQALCALGIHYTQQSPENARDSGLPLWLSEDLAPFHAPFHDGALQTACRLVSMYVDGKMVKCELHPLFEGNYESTPFAYKGILTATWPWSGHYRIEPGLWVVAHFTQFIKSGWVFIDEGCLIDGDSGCITLKEPKSGDVSIIAFNRGSDACHMSFYFSGGKIPSRMHVWNSNEKDQFIKRKDISAQNGSFSICLEPDSIYSVTTTVGQCKGQPRCRIPRETEFTVPFIENYADRGTGKYPKYSLDQGGSFEVYGDEAGKCLRQVITHRIVPLDWPRRPTPEPYTLLGSLEWTNYILKVHVMLEEEGGYVLIGGRANHAPKSHRIANCYNFMIHRDGRWALRKAAANICTGSVPEFLSGRWYLLEMSFHNDIICIHLDGNKICTCQDSEIPSGQAILGSGYNYARFSRLMIDSSGGEVSCTRIDDTNPGIHFSSGFKQIRSGYEAYSRSLTMASDAGESMEYYFTGSSVAVVGKKGSDCGIARVFVDNEPAVLIDTYNAAEQYRVSIFTCCGLSRGEHKLRLIIEGKHNISATGANVYIDSIEII
jgi:galactosylceramidase